MSLEKEITELGANAKQAAMDLCTLSTRKKNRILEAMANELDARRDSILSANQLDLAAGEKAGLSKAMLDRLLITPDRLDGIIKDIHNVIALQDPVGETISSWVRPNGLEINKMRVPIGVIGIIYESRPNVTADASVLCFKTANAVILRGGKEAKETNRAIADALQEGGEKKGLPPGAIQLVNTTDRKAVQHLITLDDYVDMIIPRGGESLIRAVSEGATVPVLKHYKGVCHTFVDASADLDMAEAICVNAKVQRPGVCNAMETLLVHKEIAEEFIPRIANTLLEHHVELRGDKEACALVPEMKPATEKDWDEEYLDLILSIRIVDDLNQAIAHINQYGSGHSDAIVTTDETAEKAFLGRVDAATVYVNASTRFTDGAAFGLGAEIGISTDKLHARGPMGLEELTTYKYVIKGTGQIRE